MAQVYHRPRSNEKSAPAQFVTAGGPGAEEAALDSLSWGVPLWFVLSLALLALANRWFSQHLWNVAYLLSGDETVAGFVHFAVLLPGVLLHEASH